MQYLEARLKKPPSVRLAALTYGLVLYSASRNGDRVAFHSYTAARISRFDREAIRARRRRIAIEQCRRTVEGYARRRRATGHRVGVAARWRRGDRLVVRRADRSR